MAKTEKEKKQIIADYIECHNYSEVGRKYNMSGNAIKKIVLADKESSKLFEQKSKKNTEEVLEAIKKRSKKKIKLIDKILKAMDGKLDNLDMFTNIKDLATAYGIIMDKELKIRELDLREKEIKDKTENNQETLQRLDEVLKNIGGVI